MYLYTDATFMCLDFQSLPCPTLEYIWTLCTHAKNILVQQMFDALSDNHQTIPLLISATTSRPNLLTRLMQCWFVQASPVT